MNQVQDKDSRKVAASGGVIILFSFVISILFYISFRSFIFQDEKFVLEALVLLTVVMLASGIGLIDDLIGWRKGGLSKTFRILSLVIAAIPLMVINAGKSTVALPFLGPVDIGLIYTFIFIPIGVAGAANGMNFLAGFNGLEAGQGVLLISALGLVAFFTGSSWLALVSLIMIAALIAFLFFNFYPAKIFPGDSGTYAIGALVATIAILGNFERIAVFFFIPSIIEAFLKIRGKLIKQSFGKPNKDETLEMPYDKIYSLNHLAILMLTKLGVKATQRKVVLLIWIFQVIIILAGLLIFQKGIFI